MGRAGHRVSHIPGGSRTSPGQPRAPMGHHTGPNDAVLASFLPLVHSRNSLALQCQREHKGQALSSAAAESVDWYKLKEFILQITCRIAVLLL